ncbi:lasso peptide biosynthesis PqqD family chaperone [Streptomyces sp. NRRL S-1448]|uniref:lasso peptide biosynthesis PqqD family chaperone n=1 Tax=Streptomyces sp. NRRL S-1448 TaxID=1463883 RepID=UPI0004BEFC56|nr:lasso peptide biosynthesis PqqD family chaperone [Streptomyces sp. NRRL S-1448]
MNLHPDVVSTDTDDGTVLLNQRTGRYWQLNTTGAYVLRQLLAGRTPHDIAADLAARHHLDTARAEQDVTAVLTQLRSADLVAA